MGALEKNMGRLHSKGKGIARRSLPYKRTAPSWVKQSAGECVKEICAMAKKGFTPSQIGVVLRDSHGIPQVKMVAGNKIVRILRSQGLAPSPLRTCTALSRRPSPCASTWRRTARTRIPSSVSFLSSPVSTVSHVTTSSPSALQETGVTSLPTLLPSLSKQKQNQWRTTQVFLICVANKKIKAFKL